MKADITNRKELNIVLNKLTDKTEAKWGLMKPQNMIKHLARTLQIYEWHKNIPHFPTRPLLYFSS